MPRPKHKVAVSGEGTGGANGGAGLGDGLCVASGTASVAHIAIHHNQAVGSAGHGGMPAPHSW